RPRDCSSDVCSSDLSDAALKLYGSLTASQRRLLDSGQTLPYASLSNQQRQLAEQVVYGAGASHTSVDESPAQIGDLSLEPTFSRSEERRVGKQSRER